LAYPTGTCVYCCNTKLVLFN